MPHVREATGAPPRVSGGDSVLPESERRLILRGVSWAAYDRLLTDMTDSHAAHLAYDRGVLEIMVLSVAHERLNRRLAALFEALAEGSGIDCENLGSASLIHQDAARGCEPDSCFYVRDAERIRETEAIDLAVDPPPDLIVEVDLTSHSLDKLPIYAGIGVSEVWRYAAGTLTLLILDEGRYVVGDESGVLPHVTRADLQRFLEDGARMKRAVWLRRVRAWARARSRGG